MLIQCRHTLIQTGGITYWYLCHYEYYHNNPFYIRKMPDRQSETYFDHFFGYWGHSHARAPVSTGLSQYALYYRAGSISPRLHNCCLLALNSSSSSFLNLFCLIILSLSKLLPDTLKLGIQTRFLTHTHTLPSNRHGPVLSGSGKLRNPVCPSGERRGFETWESRHTVTSTQSHHLHLQTVQLSYSVSFARFSQIWVKSWG